MAVMRRCPMCRGEGFTDVTVGSVGAEADLCGCCDGTGTIKFDMISWMRGITERERREGRLPGRGPSDHRAS